MADKHTKQHRWDLFISYAHEDLQSFAKPLGEKLISLGLKVWFDLFTLRIGDSLRRRINDGLKESKYGVVVLSESFFSKEWPQMELDGLTALGTVILPVWHNVDSKRVGEFSPILADKVGIPTSKGVDYVAREIFGRIRGSEQSQYDLAVLRALLKTSGTGPKLLSILRAIPRMGGVYRRYLSAQLDIPEYETRYCLSVLLDRNLIRLREDAGRDIYYLTSLGRLVLDGLEV